MSNAQTAQSQSEVYVCQQCPFGCVITVSFDTDGNLASISGNTCERGEEYAKLRAQGLDDKAIQQITGEGVSRNASAGQEAATEEDSADKPARPARYSAYRKRKKQAQEDA